MFNNLELNISRKKISCFYYFTLYLNGILYFRKSIKSYLLYNVVILFRKTLFTEVKKGQEVACISPIGNLTLMVLKS